MRAKSPLHLLLILPSAAKIVLRSDDFFDYIARRDNVEIDIPDISVMALSSDPMASSAIERLKLHVPIKVIPTDLGKMCRHQALEPDTKINLDDFAYLAIYREYATDSDADYCHVFDKWFLERHVCGQRAENERHVCAEEIAATPELMEKP